jgi:hypothetical protein
MSTILPDRPPAKAATCVKFLNEIRELSAEIYDDADDRGDSATISRCYRIADLAGEVRFALGGLR